MIDSFVYGIPVASLLGGLRDKKKRVSVTLTDSVLTCSDLNCLLAISKDRVVTSSSSALLRKLAPGLKLIILVVYDTNTFKFCNLFTYHRESVQCLVKVNSNFDALYIILTQSADVFASGSLDGVIVIWRMGSLTPLKKLNYPEKFFTITDTIKSYTSSVNHLLVLGSVCIALFLVQGILTILVEVPCCLYW